MSYCVCLLIVMSNILSYRVFLGGGGLMSYLCYLCLFQHVLTMCVTWKVSYKRQEMLIIDVT